MKIAILGLGVIGTTYAYAFQKAGHQVEHVLRDSKRNNAPKSLSVDLLDGRYHSKGENKHDVAWLEGRIDAMQEVLKPIDKFTIPGGNAVVSMCHVCRTVCRRAERAALRADARYGVDSTALVWLNRLSDYFYLLGRTLTAHYAVDEVLWIP